MMPHGWSREANAQRLEDLQWMASTGEGATGSAKRLGITYTALEKWCTRHARDLWSQLLAQEPRDWNYQTNGANQWTSGRTA